MIHEKSDTNRKAARAYASLFLFASNDASEKPVLAQCHLPGSHFLTLKDDLTGDATTGKGRHPLPAMHAFSDHMMDLGLSPDTPVLIYGNGPNMFAFRLWWMLKAIGVKDVVILYDPAMHWKEQGTDAPADKPAHKGKGLSFDPRSIIEMSGVKRLIENKEATLIDSRDKERYIGIKDEMDHKPGHIPTALSYPYEDLLTDKMPDEDTIRAHFQNLPTDKPTHHLLRFRRFRSLEHPYWMKSACKPPSIPAASPAGSKTKTIRLKSVYKNAALICNAQHFLSFFHHRAAHAAVRIALGFGVPFVVQLFPAGEP